MVPFLRLVATVLLVSIATAQSVGSYDPYLDASDLYRMQLLQNAFEYPGDKLGLDTLAGGSMGAPYDMMGVDNDRLVDFEEPSDAGYWPEELMAELAAAAAAEQEEEESSEDVGGEQNLVDEAGEVAETPEEPAEEAEAAEVGEEAEKEEDAAQGEDESKEDVQQIVKDATKYSGAQLRDQEHLEHSALHGYQKVSGGTVNGQNKQTKTDKALPAYCNPPNPCPVGKTAEDNCVENFENSAENNQRLLSEQECPCDTEHMFTCPEGSQTVSSKPQGNAPAGSAGSSSEAADASQQMQINKVISQLSGIPQEAASLENNPTISATRKRITLVAKKSPHLIRKRSEQPNPYMTGDEIRTVAKKDPYLAKNAFKPNF